MGSITALCISMKLLVLAIAAISTASKAVTCDECQAAVTDLVARLLSEESLAEQKAILKLTICPQLPDIDCEGTLDMWFPDMASCIYNHFMLEQDVCGELLGLCYKKSQKVQLLERVSDWTCEECTDILARAADYMSSEETVAEAVAYLQGDCFCGQDGHTEDCGALVETVLPMAMPVLGAALMEQSTELCQEVVGVC